MDTAAKGAKKNTLPNVLHLLYIENTLFPQKSFSLLSDETNKLFSHDDQRSVTGVGLWSLSLSLSLSLSSHTLIIYNWKFQGNDINILSMDELCFVMKKKHMFDSLLLKQ